MTVSDYPLRTSHGRKIRTASKITLEDGREIRLMEKVSKRAAAAWIERYGEALDDVTQAAIRYMDRMDNERR